MKSCAVILVFLVMPLPLSGQRSVKGTRGTSQVHRKINFLELARREAEAPAKKPERRVVPFMRTPPSSRAPKRTATAEAPARTSAVPLAPTPSDASPSPAASFVALGDDDTAIPPDTQGAAGPNHLMVTLNNNVGITNRSGGAPTAVTLESFWTGTGASGVFDPKVVYDHMAGRWIFCAMSDKRSADSSLLIGTSDTNNPTGTWDLYLVDADPNDVYWADYPSVGFNKDWIVVTYNAFQNTDDAFVQSDIFAFKKADLYGGIGATHTIFHDDGASTLAPAITFDDSLATMFLVQTFFGNISGDGSLEVETITGAVGSETYTFSTAFPVPPTPTPWEDSAPGGADFAPQMGTTDKIQNGDSRMLKLVYRNSSLWATHTVFLPAGEPATRSAVQWWQFETDGTVLQFGRIDDGTGAVFRAYPSLAVNSQSDVLIGYSTFSGTTYASGSYSFRAGSDPASTLRSEVLLKAGEATYYKTFGGPDNRWGDYSNTVVDPANDLDFWTIQEYANSPDFPNGDDRWGTWWGKIVVSPAAAVKRRGQITAD